jgi:hypothetical protein
MFWRMPLNDLPSLAVREAPIDMARILAAIRNFTNPLWPTRAPATPLVGEEGDQGSERRAGRGHA